FSSVTSVLSCCLVLEDLVIERYNADNVEGIYAIVPSLHSLSLCTKYECFYDGFLSIDLTKFGFNMPELEEADIIVENDLDKFLESVTSVKRLSLRVLFNNNEKLSICSDYWWTLLFRLLQDSPKLRVLNIDADGSGFTEYVRINWGYERSVPKCLLMTLETFKFEGYRGRREERNFLSFFLKNARRLKSTSILHSSTE
ncbi:hypothetical protein N665_2990s0001, partial [Sinapis alba]